MDTIDFLTERKTAALRRLEYRFEDLKKQLDTYDATSYPVKYAIEAYKDTRDAYDNYSKILAMVKANCKE